MLVTTLRNHRRVSKDELSQLYARRWNVELDLRNVKTTTSMDVSRYQTPETRDKQLWTHLLAYSLNDGERLFTLIAQSKVGHRLGRIEPRMRQRLPKPYPWLKTPRAHARSQVQRYRHAWTTK